MHTGSTLQSSCSLSLYTIITYRVTAHSESQYGVGLNQARSQGGVSGCSATTTNLNASTRNLQNIKGEIADQRAKKCATPYRIFCCLC
jgi:hypothetical protein